MLYQSISRAFPISSQLSHATLNWLLHLMVISSRRATMFTSLFVSLDATTATSSAALPAERAKQAKFGVVLQHNVKVSIDKRQQIQPSYLSYIYQKKKACSKMHLECAPKIGV